MKSQTVTTADDARNPFGESSTLDEIRAFQPEGRRDRVHKIKALDAATLELRRAHRHRRALYELSTHTASAAGLIAGKEKPLATPGELKALREIQTRYDAAREQLAANDYSHLGKNRKAVVAAYDADPSSANLEKLKGVADGDAQERERQRRIMRPIKDQLRKIAAEGSPIVAAIFERVAQLADAESESIRAAEEKQAARFGLPHEYGPIHGSLRRLADLLRGPIRIVNTPPRALLAGIVKL